MMIYKPDPAYIKQRNALVPSAEIMAQSAASEAGLDVMEPDGQALWSLTFHLWMDRLAATNIHHKGWPR